MNPGLFWSQKTRQLLDERPRASEKVHHGTASSSPAATAAALLLMHEAEDLCLCPFVGLGSQPVPNVKKARGKPSPLKQRLVAGLRVAGVCLQMLDAFSLTDVPTATCDCTLLCYPPWRQPPSTGPDACWLRFATKARFHSCTPGAWRPRELRE